MKMVNERVSPLSLSAVVMGALVGLLSDLGFTLLGTGLGLGAMEADIMFDVTFASLFGIGIFTVTAMVVSFTLAGYVASRCSPALQRWDAIIHGIGAFAVSALTMVFLIGSSAGLGVGGILTRMGLSPISVSFVALGLLILGALSAGFGAVLGLKGALAAAHSKGEHLSRVDDLAA